MTCTDYISETHRLDIHSDADADDRVSQLKFLIGIYRDEPITLQWLTTQLVKVRSAQNDAHMTGRWR